MQQQQIDRVKLCAALAQSTAAVLSKHLDGIPGRLGRVGILVEETGAIIERAVARSLSQEQWLYFRISSDPSKSKGLVAHELGPLLRDVGHIHPFKGWWWLYKADVRGPAVRLRVFVSNESSSEVEAAIKSRLSKLHHDFTMPCYEPEILLFGGPHGMQAAHEFLCADSAFLASWAETDSSPTGSLIPEGLSLALIMRVLQAANFDLFERWDVFDRVAQKRAFGQHDDKRFQRYAELVRKIIAAGPDQVFELYASTKSRLLTDHVAFLDKFGRTMSSLYINGLLECGLREFFVPIILFHWNRLLLSPFAHFGLSHAVAHELARLSRQGMNAQLPKE